MNITQKKTARKNSYVIVCHGGVEEKFYIKNGQKNCFEISIWKSVSLLLFSAAFVLVFPFIFYPEFILLIFHAFFFSSLVWRLLFFSVVHWGWLKVVEGGLKKEIKKEQWWVDCFSSIYMYTSFFLFLWRLYEVMEIRRIDVVAFVLCWRGETLFFPLHNYIKQH